MFVTSKAVADNGWQPVKQGRMGSYLRLFHYEAGVYA